MNIEAKNRVNMEDRSRASQPSGFVLMESSLLSYPPVLRTFWSWSMRAFVPIPRFNWKIWTLLRQLTAQLFWIVHNLCKGVDKYVPCSVTLLPWYKWAATPKVIQYSELEGSRQCHLHDHVWPSVTLSNIIEEDRQWSLCTIAEQPSVTFLPRTWYETNRHFALFELNLYIKILIIFY